MKTNLLMQKISGLAIALLISFPMINLSAQVPGNILTNGGMEADDEAAWHVEIIARDDLGDVPEYEFGYDGGCTACEGNGLRVWAAGSGYTNIIFWKKVTLKAGVHYKADAAYKSLDEMAQNNWAQLKLKVDTFPQHENDGEKLIGMNYWNGCGPYVDGTFMADGCDGLESGENPHGYIAPDTLGAEFDAWFAIVIGMWTNAATGAYPYDILIDEVVLIDSTEAASVSTGPEKISNSATLMNFPNPFNEKTTIVYELPTRSDVRLSVYNLLGQEVTTLYEGMREAGTHRAELDVSGYNNSVLICKLEYNNQVIIRKMTMLE